MFIFRVILSLLLLIQLNYTSYSTVTIEIFPENRKPSHPSRTTPAAATLQPKPMSYNDVHGRGMIFDYHPTDTYQENFIKDVQLFDQKLETKVSQNYILVCIQLGNLRFPLQHIFFSGNVESVSHGLYLNIATIRKSFSVQTTTDKCIDPVKNLYL